MIRFSFLELWNLNKIEWKSRRSYVCNMIPRCSICNKRQFFVESNYECPTTTVLQEIIWTHPCLSIFVKRQTRVEAAAENRVIYNWCLQYFVKWPHWRSDLYKCTSLSYARLKPHFILFESGWCLRQNFSIFDHCADLSVYTSFVHDFSMPLWSCVNFEYFLYSSSTLWRV